MDAATATATTGPGRDRERDQAPFHAKLLLLWDGSTRRPWTTQVPVCFAPAENYPHSLTAVPQFSCSAPNWAFRWWTGDQPALPYHSQHLNPEVLMTSLRVWSQSSPSRTTACQASGHRGPRWGTWNWQALSTTTGTWSPLQEFKVRLTQPTNTTRDGTHSHSLKDRAPQLSKWSSSIPAPENRQVINLPVLNWSKRFFAKTISTKNQGTSVIYGSQSHCGLQIKWIGNHKPQDSSVIRKWMVFLTA